MSTWRNRVSLAKAVPSREFLSLSQWLFSHKKVFKLTTFMTLDSSSGHLGISLASCILFCISLAQWWHQRGHLVRTLLLILPQPQFSSFSTNAKRENEVEINKWSPAASRYRFFPQCVLMEPTSQCQGEVLVGQTIHSQGDGDLEMYHPDRKRWGKSQVRSEF